MILLIRCNIVYKSRIPSPYPLPEGEGFCFRRPFLKIINVGVGSKPTLLCNHARKSNHKVRSQPFFPRHTACTISFSLTLTLSRRARVFGFGVPSIFPHPHPNPLPKGEGFCSNIRSFRLAFKPSPNTRRGLCTVAALRFAF